MSPNIPIDPSKYKPIVINKISLEGATLTEGVKSYFEKFDYYNETVCALSAVQGDGKVDVFEAVNHTSISENLLKNPQQLNTWRMRLSYFYSDFEKAFPGLYCDFETGKVGYKSDLSLAEVEDTGTPEMKGLFLISK